MGRQNSRTHTSWQPNATSHRERKTNLRMTFFASPPPVVWPPPGRSGFVSLNLHKWSFDRTVLPLCWILRLVGPKMHPRPIVLFQAIDCVIPWGQYFKSPVKFARKGARQVALDEKGFPSQEMQGTTVQKNALNIESTILNISRTSCFLFLRGLRTEVFTCTYSIILQHRLLLCNYRRAQNHSMNSLMRIH